MQSASPVVLESKVAGFWALGGRQSVVADSRLEELVIPASIPKLSQV